MATIWFHSEQDDTCVTCSNIIEAYYISSVLCMNPPSLLTIMNQFDKKSYHVLEKTPVNVSIYNGIHDPPVYSGFPFGINRINVSELLANTLYIKRKNDVSEINMIKKNMKRFVTLSMRDLTRNVV